MAFKKTLPPVSVPDSPDKLFLDLPRRKYNGLIDHQAQMLRTYAKSGANESDVALQLPTGSGKTLVGLLIAEWRRRKSRERAVYLCPTNQLVNQVAEEARTKYGLDVDGFTGPIREYDPAAKARYANSDRVAVTTYSALFNTNPFFDDPHLIIVDDAHAAENYIAKLWSLRIERSEPAHAALFTAIAAVLKSYLPQHLYLRIVGEPRSLADRAWNDKLPSPDLVQVASDLREVIDEHVRELDLRYPWQMISERLEACQLYMSASEFLIRPLIPPTWSHEPFSEARQRVFMSATLGAGGDLERLTGCRSILRLPIPDGWDKQGIGRRFFIFPAMSLNEPDARVLCRRMMKMAGRSLVLVPSDAAARALTDDVTVELKFKTFSAPDIEETKKPFVESKQAVAIVANRYDGIDFPGDDCRLLFIEGLPKAVNLQERFLMSRMGANLLLNERVQTRVLQAVGRCTRGLNDYSAVVVSGEELADYLVDRDRRAYLHPELQGELEFGIEQSMDVDAKNLLENFSIFLEHQEDWEAVNQDILTKRDAATRRELPAMAELQRAVEHEIRYQMRMWQADYESAFDEAREVLGLIVAAELRGYRALWHYLAGSAALLAAKAGQTALEGQARLQFSRAKEAAHGIPWLVSLARFVPESGEPDRNSTRVMRQIERLEVTLESLGKLHNRAFSRREAEVLTGLDTANGFENAHRLLGELLGFSVGKVEADASPDPWWLADDIGFVFEDHAGTTSIEPVVDATKARQAATHVDWMKLNVPAVKDANILPVLITAASRATKGAQPSLMRVGYWPLAEFRDWAKRAIGVIRELRKTFREPGDIDWRIKAAEAFEENGLDASSLHLKLSRRLAGEHMQIAE